MIKTTPFRRSDLKAISQNNLAGPRCDKNVARLALIFASTGRKQRTNKAKFQFNFRARLSARCWDFFFLDFPVHLQKHPLPRNCRILSWSILRKILAWLKGLAGLETQTQNAAFFERKRPKRKPWHRGKSLNRKKKKRLQCVFWTLAFYHARP